MKPKRSAPLARHFGYALAALLFCFPPATWADAWQKLAEIPVVGGRNVSAMTDMSPLNEYWPVIRLRQIDGGQYAGQAKLRTGPDTARPLGCRINSTGALPGAYSCNVCLPARAFAPGETVTVRATRTGSEISNSQKDWSNVQVATVFVDGGPWRAEVPVIMDLRDRPDTNGHAKPTIMLHRLGLDNYEGSTNVKIGSGAGSKVSCKIAPAKIYPGTYSCWFRPADFKSPGGIAIVGADIENLETSGRPGGYRQEKIATLSLQGQSWHADIPVIATVGGVAFVPRQDQLRFKFQQTSIHTYEAGLELQIETRTDLMLKCEIAATGVIGGAMSCAVKPASFPSSDRTAKLFVKLKDADLTRSPGPLHHARIATVTLYGKPRQPKGRE